ncbi:MAG: MBL fold metallo-hydrolase, partial [Desulfobacula sp.]|nr:MBL fold metallo-hydrolase [Desulfobacula sp.]
MRKIDKVFRWATACLFRWNWNPIKTGKLADGLFALRIGIVNMFVYTDGNNTIAIDASYKTPGLIDEFKKINIDPLSITHLFLTHSDIDHAGSYGIFKNAQVYLSKEEEQMINGLTTRVPGIYSNPKILNTYNLLSDSDEIAAGNINVRAISTP